MPEGGVEPPSLLPSLFGDGRGFAAKLFGRVSRPEGTAHEKSKGYIVNTKLADAVLTTLPGLQASIPHQLVFKIKMFIQTFG